MPDRIVINGLACHIPNGVGPSAFGLIPAPPCPLELDVTIDLRPDVVPRCVDEDEMEGLGVNYSSVSKGIYALLTDKSRMWQHPSDLLLAVASVPLLLPAVNGVSVRATMRRGLLQAKAAQYTRYFNCTRSGKSSSGPMSCTIKDLSVNCVIGLHPHERAERQRLECDISVTHSIEHIWSHKDLADCAYDWLEQSSFGTLESLADTFANYIVALPFFQNSNPRVDVTIRKPSALPFATPSITVTRTEADFVGRANQALSRSSLSAAGPRVFIAVGSNIGDTVGNIRRAVKALEAGGCVLRDTSRLYESEPMYHLDQELFLNGVIEVSTELSPIDLLRLLKRTESEIGRTKTFQNGPRVIDLDLVLYGSEVVRIGKPGDKPDADGVGWLECPHPRIAEREFVLRPLADIAPTISLPGNGSTVADLLATVEPGGLTPVIPFPAPARPLRLTNPATPAIMAIFNATPDSFSDGHASRTDTATALASCEALASMPVPPAIIDIGGMSTRPGSEPCSEADELARVVPLVEAIRASNGSVNALPLSIDTYRPSVAKAAIAAGASCINDVRGGSEPGMLEVMAAADVPVVLMHSRGDSVTMGSDAAQAYEGGVVQGVRTELATSVQRALEAGVKRWDIVLDPGLGFAKSHADGLTLLRHLPVFLSGDHSAISPPKQRADEPTTDSDTAPSTPGIPMDKPVSTDHTLSVKPLPSLDNFPLLVGASRKGFVGKVTGVSVAAERGFGDSAVNAWCTASGVVDILRVHDVKAAAESVAMAAAIRDA